MITFEDNISKIKANNIFEKTNITVIFLRLNSKYK